MWCTLSALYQSKTVSILQVLLIQVMSYPCISEMIVQMKMPLRYGYQRK